MMMMKRVNGDFAHWRSMARTRVRDTALQHKMQLQGDNAPQRRDFPKRTLANALFYCRMQDLEFNIIDIIRAGRLKSVLRCGNSPQIGVLTPPRKNGGGANAKVLPTHPRKKISTPPSYEVLT